MKYLLSLISGLVLLAQVSFAGNYSYIYIEGDKQTPFYVKLEGQMMPRLGKNYCIIPNLAAGTTYIEILFQQNTYPAQKFAILVPEAGSRGFVLQKVNDRQFALYDIQQGSYLVSGNKPEEDHLPAVQAAGTIPEQTGTVATGSNEDAIPAFRTGKKDNKKKPAKKTEEQQPEDSKTDSRFIGDMELNPKPGQLVAAEPIPDFKAPEPSAKSKKKPQKEEGSLAAISDEEDRSTDTPKEATPVDNGVPNTDCKTPMSSEEFENFALKILDKTDDDARIKVLSKNKGRQCFTTEQVRIIANNLETQSGRYDVVKMLYTQTSDQGNYPQLESLFKTNYLKGKFQEILTPKQ